MSYNNKTLLLILIGLVAIYFTTDFLRQRSRDDRSLPDRLLLVDEATLNAFTIDPPGGAPPLQFSKTDGTWEVEQAGRRSRADQSAVQRLLSDLEALAPERLVANSEERWEDYAVTDSLATRVRFEASAGDLAQELLIGRFNYQPPAGGFNNQPMMGQQRISGTTYVRRGGEARIYAVDGFLAMSVPGEFNAWRSADFIELDPSVVTRLQFDHPADSSFTLASENGRWMLNEQPADSSAVANYLNRLRNRQVRRFADDFQPTTSPQHRLTIQRSGADPVILQSWPDTAGGYFLHSSLNPTAYFESETDGLADQLFVGKAGFLSEE